MTARPIAPVILTLLSTPAFAVMPNCGERSDLMAQIRQRHLEKPGAVETVSPAGSVELVRGDDGRWALILTEPTGRSCQLAAGEALAPVQADALEKAY